ncbi:hypothetical protein E4U43_004137 [Claviceps pusilla]|uniref:Pheromone receptor n=1 Tax=Claviceps pusilla TaxID=123648 RepID=A0A9P7SUX6_9HYPO|nr:hypothetical protein E4U43_004137 [Claviceps pusilla]
MDSSPSTPARLLHQTITLLTPQDPIAIPITSIDAFNDESISVSLNYGFQLGACFLLLLVTLLLTPPSKMLRPSSLLHMAALAVCIVRTALLEAFFLSPLNHLYPVWSGDFASVPRFHLHNSVAGTCFSLLLLMVLEAALMHQAWTMVSLWPSAVKLSLVAASALVSLVTVGWRFAFAVVQSKAALGLVSTRSLGWVGKAALVLNCLSICWFCALFNVKLVLHLLTNRGILRSASTRKALSPMEVLVMTNGVLMVVPVIFAALEWAHFPNFESASLTHTSVALILPLGTLAAQQITHGSTLAYLSPAASANPHGRSNNSSNSNSNSNSNFVGTEKFHNHTTAVATSPPLPPHGKFASVSTTCGSGSPTCLLTSSSSASSSSHVSGAKKQRLDHFDLELRQIDSTSELADHVRVDMDVEQEETRI